MASARVIFLSVVNAFLSVFGTFMTFLVILAILKNLELQKGLNLLIVSLTAADLINCLIAQPMYVFYLSNGLSGSYLVAFEIIAYIGLHAVFSNLITITYHRMKALSRPFYHLLLVSRKELIVVIALTWVVSIIIGVVFSTEPGKVAGPYVHAVMILCLLLTYIRILLVSWKRRRRQIVDKAGTVNYHQQAATMEQENAAAVTSAILVGTTLLCFLPDVLLDLIGKGEVNRLLWNYTLLFASSALNPCIVIWRNQQFRRTLLQMLRLAN
ncbi:uncharacterized protein LOC144665791 [Oculina patagonica]